jgi:hypothetical protein
MLRIVDVKVNADGDTATLTWSSHPTRLYQVEERLDLNTGSWSTNTTLGVVVPDAGTTTTRSVSDATASKRFFRVQAVMPLSP